jgi:glycogen debranching enzyme
MPLYTIATNGQLYPHLFQEWLITNGIGGFASSTVVGCNTRRYHGLLCAATLPPVGRVIALSRVGEILRIDGKAEPTYEFSINQFGGRFHPRGDQYLQTFELGDFARWEFDVAGVKVVKDAQMRWLTNATGIRYTIDPQGHEFELAILPFVALRDFHSLRHGPNADFKTYSGVKDVAIASGDLSLNLTSDHADWLSQPDWWHGHTYAVEAERGQDSTEELYTPGRFVVKGHGPTTVTLWASTSPLPWPDWEAELTRRRETIAEMSTIRPAGAAKPPVSVLISASALASQVAASYASSSHGSASQAAASQAFPASGSPGASLHPTPIAAGSLVPSALASEAVAPGASVLARLAHAANDFIVARRAPDGKPGYTVMAGYPWFADWGRDTMISLPGLLLSTGRFEQAREVLSVFAQYVSEGMIPNRFDDYTNEPSYNTVDASLWFVHAAYEYFRLSGDKATFDATLHPACEAIVAGYQHGTRFHIQMDPADGLVTQGDAGTQLTWMDAKCENVTFTPRQGKAVEINALWYHALKLTGKSELAEKAAASFRKVFWISPFRGLADVYDDGHVGQPKPPRKDSAIRPNQIFAVSLPNSPLLPEQQSAVVEVVRRELLTPMGLRTLATSDPGYKGRYTGRQFDRDAAYHNGTVWAWLIGPFISAYLKVNHKSEKSVEQARTWLRPLIDGMNTTACIGQISEIFEGEPPHRAVGCFAQAWSVAEVLRVANELGM